MLSRERVSFWAGVLSILGALVLVFLPALFFHQVLYCEDIYFLHVPYKTLFYQMGRMGGLFFWNPGTFSGCSNLGFGYFYPLNWLFFILPTVKAYWICCFLHMFLAGFFLFGYLRYLRLGVGESAVGGLLFSLSGFFLSETRHFDLLCASAYLPALFWCWDKRKDGPLYLSLGALVFGLQFLAGSPSPQMSYVSALGLLLKMLWDMGDKNSRKLEIVGSGLWIFGVGFLLAAVNWMTFLPLWKLTGRQFLKGLNFANTCAWPLDQVLAFFVPGIFPRMDDGILIYYFGFLGTLLAIVGAIKGGGRKWFWVMLAVLGFWLALGENGGLNTLLALIVPFYRSLRTPARYLLLSVFSLSILAAFGLEYLKRRNARLAVLAGALVLGEALWLSFSGLPFTSPYDYSPKPAFARIKIAEKKSPCPVRCFIADFPECNRSIISGLSNIAGYNPLVPYYYIEYLWFMAKNKLPDTQAWWGVIWHSNAVMLNKWNNNMIGLLGVKYLFVLEGKDYSVYRFKHAGKRYFLAGDYRVIPQPAQLLSALSAPAFKPFTQVLYQRSPDFPNRQPVEGMAVLKSYSPDRLEFEVENRYPNILVLSEVDFPGWEARVDGKKTPIYRADYIFRSVCLLPGRHRVVFSYRPVGLTAGLLLSLGGFLLLLGGYFYRRSLEKR